MKKSRFYVLAAVSGMLLAGCTNELIETPDAKEKEAFAQAFINNFCVPAEGHTFSMAKWAEITVQTSTPTDIMVVGNTGGKRYLFAECEGVTNGQKITFDVPADMKNLLVLANNQGYPVKVGGTVNLDADTNSSKVRSRDEGTPSPTFDPNTLPATMFVEITGTDGCEEDDIDYATFPTSNLFSGRMALKSKKEPVDVARGKGDYWRGDVGPSVLILQEALKQLVTTGMNATQISDFYSAKTSDDNTKDRFERVNSLTHYYYGPGMYVHYMRKPNGKNYILGMMIGNETNLHESTKIYKVPLLNTATMVNPVEYYVPNNVTNLSYRGARVTFDFDDNDGKGTYVVDEESSSHMSNLYKYGKDLTPEFKKQITDMYYLYENGILPYAYKEGNNIKGGIDDAYGKITPYENDKQYRYSLEHKIYLHNKCKALKSDPTYGDKVHDLYDVKALLTYSGGIFDQRETYNDEDLNIDAVYIDYPEVEKIEGENKYVVTYWMSMARTANADHRMDNGDATRGSFFEPTTPDDHTLFNAWGTWVNVPETIKRHEYCYYVEFEDGTYKTTYDGNMVETSEVKYNDTGVYHRGNIGIDKYICWDINDDDIYDDIIFNTANAFGGESPFYDSYRWFLACEDLGSSNSSDTDYNDVVVSLKYSKSGSNLHQSKVDIQPMAAGGIYPVYPMVEDGLQNGIVGKEIHEWLGSTNTGSDLEMINTDADKMEEKQFTAPVAKYEYNREGGDHFSLSGMVQDQNFTGHNKGVRFYVIVDRQNKIATESRLAELNSKLNAQEVTWLSDEEYSVIFDELGIYKINNVPIAMETNGNDVNIPLIICVGSDWEWPKETKNIKTVYPDFTNWLSNPDQYFQEVEGQPIKKWYGVNGEDFIEGLNRDNAVKRK